MMKKSVRKLLKQLVLFVYSVRFNLSVMGPENKFFGKCRFMDGTHRAPVALASMPGSGNTWVRGLLQQATGICPGQFYVVVVQMLGKG